VTKARPKRTRLDARKPITRQKIIDATQQLILESGSGSLTKATICERAGVDRSIIYDHFADVEACVRAAAEQIGKQLVERDAKLRRVLSEPSESGVERSILRTRVYLQASLDAPDAARLAIRCRHEDSELGRTIREAAAKADGMLADDLWQGAVRRGLRSLKTETFTLCARLITTTNHEAVAFLMEDPQRDLESVARAVGTWTHNAVQGLIDPLIRADIPGPSDASGSR